MNILGLILYYHLLTNNNGDSLLDLSEDMLAFNTVDYSDGDYRIFVEAQDEAGNTSTDSMDVKFKNGIVPVKSASIITEYRLDQAFPNPFNPSTTITYEIPRQEEVSIILYDLLGREIAILLNEVKHAGRYTLKISGSNLSSGVYLYRMRTGSFISTKKVLLLK